MAAAVLAAALNLANEKLGHHRRTGGGGDVVGRAIVIRGR
jgi:hypothetical protein